MKAFWNDRYGQEEYAYGEEPNRFFAEQLEKLHPGKILLPAEGEGRNAVFAARQGWEVTAFDWSLAGKEKAEKLAEKHGVNIDYRVGEFQEMDFTGWEYDAIGLIFAHFPADKKIAYHQRMRPWLRAGGKVIFEAFSKSHLEFRKKNPRAGGPPDIDTLFSTEEVRHCFPDFVILSLEQTEVHLQEGDFHAGKSSVVRFVGEKAESRPDTSRVRAD